MMQKVPAELRAILFKMIDGKIECRVSIEHGDVGSQHTTTFKRVFTGIENVRGILEHHINTQEYLKWESQTK